MFDASDVESTVTDGIHDFNLLKHQLSGLFKPIISTVFSFTEIHFSIWLILSAEYVVIRIVNFLLQIHQNSLVFPAADFGSRMILNFSKQPHRRIPRTLIFNDPTDGIWELVVVADI